VRKARRTHVRKAQRSPLKREFKNSLFNVKFAVTAGEV
jgi:hypothetical protein